MRRKPYRGTWTHYACEHPRSPENTVPSGPTGHQCRICKLAYQKAYRERKGRGAPGVAKHHARTMPVASPKLELSTDAAVQLYRLEKAKAAERHAPAKAQLQARIEAAWKAQREADLQAQKGGRPCTKGLAGNVG